MHERADTIVWFPDDPSCPAPDVVQWLSAWLLDEPGRTLVYVGRDFDATARYWEKYAAATDAPQTDETRRRAQEAQRERNAVNAAVPADCVCDWFTLEGGHAPRPVKSINGNADWLAGIDPLRTEIELGAKITPADGARIILAADDDMLMSRERLGHSQLILVSNGSMLLNLPLVNHEHRKLAGHLIDAVGPPGHVVFLGSGAGGPTILDEDPSGQPPTALAVFGIDPLRTVFLHLAVLGIVFAMSRYPIFGVPRGGASSHLSDFGRHIEALGALFRRTGDAAAAQRRVQNYHALVRGESQPTRATEPTARPRLRVPQDLSPDAPTSQ